MNVNIEKSGYRLVVRIIGRLDTVTAPELETKLRNELTGVKDLIIDITDLQYISSAGLRVLLSAQKTMKNRGKMIVKGANDSIMEVFDVTGFVDLLNIE